MLSSIVELTQARYSGEPLALAVLDLDRFKSVNDSWGHDAGDRVLEHFTEIVKRHLRRFDHVARIGGEEFAIVLSGAAQSHALLAVERVLAAVRAEAVRISDGRAISVTCSAGLASFAVEIDAFHEPVQTRGSRALFGEERRPGPTSSPSPSTVDWRVRPRHVFRRRIPRHVADDRRSPNCDVHRWQTSDEP